MKPLRVIVVGLGPIGYSCAQAVASESAMQLVGLVDTDPVKIGRTLAELGRPGEYDRDLPRVSGDLDAVLGDGVDVAIVATASEFDRVAPTLLQLLRGGAAVVSSCEQMIWPWYRNAELAQRVDAAARQAGRAVLAAGVNPGFVMDLLAVVLATMLRRVSKVVCTRRVDAGMRRTPLQAKVGATLTVERFRELTAEGAIGHKGLAESIALLAAGLGRRVEPDSVIETLEPCLAEKPTPSALGLIQPGEVCGIHNVGRWQGDGLHLALDLTMAVGLADPKDVIELDGPVRLSVKIPGSIPGDSATVAGLLNHVRIVHRAAPGLRTPLDVPPAGCHGRD